MIERLHGRLPNWKAPNRVAHPECPASRRNGGSSHQQQPRKQRHMTPTHRVEHGGELPRLRRPPVRRLDPEVIELKSSGSTLLGLARHCGGAAHLRRYWTAWSWARAPRRQPAHLRHAAGRLPSAGDLDTSAPVALRAIVSAIPRPRSGPNQRWPRSWTASAPAQWSTPTKPAGARTNGLWTQPPPNAIPGRGRGKAPHGRVVLRTGPLLRRLPPL